ncbi:MAG: lamin tail domain-containing protein [Verrucomicrobiales bacterium]|nr:lamin tail domain-containing protein [Verrucomicrobiales bacterium]
MHRWVLFALLPLTTLVHAQVDSVVVFNEIHYHPTGGGSAAEFIELYNQNSVDVDLSGWELRGAGNFVFPKKSLIEGRSYLVIAVDPETLLLPQALGPLTGTLSDGGERLTLHNHNGRIMDQIDYNDRHPWPVGADGSGASLSKRDPMASSGSASNWASSRSLGGSPGESNDTLIDPTAVFSEVPGRDAESLWIELFHAGSIDLDLDSLVIRTDQAAELPLEGNLAPGGYANLSTTFDALVVQQLYLIDQDAQTLLDAIDLKNSPQARTDYPSGEFYHPTEATPGVANVVVLEDQVVINEVMYHHRPHYADEDGGSEYEEVDEEWIELTNRGDTPVDLSSWRLRGGLSYTIEEGTILAPGGFLVIANDKQALEAKYPDIAILGNVDGTLSNSGERIELQDPLGNPADAFHYYDDAPWPADADGGGSSMELKHPGMDNSRPEAWAASDESLQSEWHTYSYRAVARRPVYTANVRSFHELRLGFLQPGRCLIDNVTVTEDPDGAAQNLVRNRTFGSLFAPITSSNWRLLGTHGQSEAINDPEKGSVLKVVAEGSMNYLNNLCEGVLSDEVNIGQTYEVSFEAKWLGGSPQFRSEVYYNKFAKKHLLIMPEKHGTPGRQNTAWEAIPGPTYSALRHDPPVPEASEDITVSVSSEDPSGIGTMTLFYRLDDDDWQSQPMDLSNTRYVSTIAGQSDDTVIQFYIKGTDADGGSSVYPARGPDSGAFIRVDSVANTSLRQSLRLALSPENAQDLHTPIRILSNERRPTTVISNEREIFYNCGLRLRGSMFSRGNGGDAGLNISFPADQRFRGTQSSILVRKRNVQEILVKHMANQAVGVPASYNDLLELRGYRSNSSWSGLARLEMARFGENYVKGAFENGDTRPVFKMEGIRDFQSAGAGDVKNPMPIGWIVAFDLEDLGEDREQYRHVLRLISARKRDEYSRIIALCQAFGSPSDEDFRERLEAVIDTDQWMRVLAMQTLCGIADVYPIENPHNFNFYVRPTDEKIIAMPWDWDFTFNLGASSRIMDPRGSNKNLWRVMDEPGINRLFRGHLLDLIDTIFNERYADEWFSRYGEVAGTSYSSHVSYVRSRASSVKNQAGSTTLFGITTNEGEDFSVAEPEVTLTGKGGVRVRTLEHVETGIHFEPYWLDDETWEVNLPLAAGRNAITLQARDYQGSKGSLFTPTGIDSINVTSTSANEAPTAETLAISEIMYHPATPTDAEIALGFTDQDAFEFLEITNVGQRSLDLRSLRFSEGIRFDFALEILEPGSVAMLVANRAAFEERYGKGLNVIGEYTGMLSNGGETLVLEGANGRSIHRFRYDDSAPWPTSADGEGFSLILTDLSGQAILDEATSWQMSGGLGGSPGNLEAVTRLTYADWQVTVFSASQLNQPEVIGFQADPDGDGFANGLEFAFGTLPNQRDGGIIQTEADENSVSIIYPQRLGTSIVIESSSDLQDWEATAAEQYPVTTLPGGTPEVASKQIVLIKGGSGYLRFRVELENP